MSVFGSNILTPSDVTVKPVTPVTISRILVQPTPDSLAQRNLHFSVSLAEEKDRTFSYCMSVAGTRFGLLTRAAGRHIPVIPASAHEQLRHNILSLLRSIFMANKESFKPKEANGLKKIPPYWYPYTTMTKQRWIGRELLEVVSTEFRDRSMEYYVRQPSNANAYADLPMARGML